LPSHNDVDGVYCLVALAVVDGVDCLVALAVVVGLAALLAPVS
jgi:hypothetical protein